MPPSSRSVHQLKIVLEGIEPAVWRRVLVPSSTSFESLVTLGEAAPVGSSFTYVYDLGDDWRHRIEAEEVLPPERGARYPRLLDGQRACPPEDIGGAMGYKAFLKGQQKGGFDPERPDLAAVARRLAGGR